jgi:glycosyltransferase involved in cell wall biosynthesis
MRILVLNWQDRLNPNAGGAETHLHEIFARIVARGHLVTALVSGWEGAEAREDVDGIEVHRAGGRYTFNLAAPRYYRGRLAHRNYDVMVEDLNKVPLFTPYWAGHPLSLLVHHLFGTTAFQEASLPVAAATWALERPLGRIYRGVPTMAVSRSTAEDLGRRGLDEERIAVIPNGVDLGHCTPGDPDQRFEVPTLLYLGRLKRYKRVDLLIRVVARLREQGLAVRLVVAGTGDHEAALRGLVDRMGVSDAVEFRGFVSEAEKVELFRRAWIHLLTSPKEGWGITNVEAAACGTPTIASDSPGLRDSVADGETGFLVPHGDIEALADRIRAVIEDRALRERLGRTARGFAERFTWDRAALETETFLESVARSA